MKYFIIILQDIWSGRGIRWDRNDRRTKLQAIIPYVPAFAGPATPVGEWMYPDADPGSFSAPWFALSKMAKEFVADCYNHGWLSKVFDWAAWVQTRRAQVLRDDPAMVASATEHELAQLLTVVIRQSGFVVEVMAAAFASGLILGIIRRAVQLGGEEGPTR